MTLVSYFNSLRELGGCRRIVEDEVYSPIERGGAAVCELASKRGCSRIDRSN